MHSPTGATAFQAYSKNKSDAINSISRAGLNLALINAAAKHPNVSFHFDHRCLDVDLDAPAVLFEHEVEPAREPGGKSRIQVVRAESDLVIGADGAFSGCGKMQKNERFDAPRTTWSTGTRAHIPAGRGRRRVRARPTPRTSGRARSMMIACQPDNPFTCTLFWPYAGRTGLRT
jgi:kynurenine 3-monooxygenase